jgi:hypothetical protein
MTTAQNLIYSKAAAARILNLDYTLIKDLEVWNKVILVKVQDQKAKFISKKNFRQHFVDWRKARSYSLETTPNIYNEELFTVLNPHKDTHYNVSLQVQELICDCEDWANQKEYLGKACCKHCYSVLNYLNYSSLKEYIEKSSVLVTA